MTGRKPIICLDFDGVIHDYKNGWEGDETTIGGDVTRGFFEWAHQARDHFKLVIYSSRSRTIAGQQAMAYWLSRQMDKHAIPIGENHLSMSDFQFAADKPPAFLTIDDRAIRFEGNWVSLDPLALLAFKPWTAAR
jgi:hypothetical protein